MKLINENWSRILINNYCQWCGKFQTSASDVHIFWKKRVKPWNCTQKNKEPELSWLCLEKRRLGGKNTEQNKKEAVSSDVGISLTRTNPARSRVVPGSESGSTTHDLTAAPIYLTSTTLWPQKHHTVTSQWHPHQPDVTHTHPQVPRGCIIHPVRSPHVKSSFHTMTDKNGL